MVRLSDVRSPEGMNWILFLGINSIELRCCRRLRPEHEVNLNPKYLKRLPRCIAVIDLNAKADASKSLIPSGQYFGTKSGT